MNSEEVKNFAPPKEGKRDPKAAQGIADFKKRFEEKHGGATNMPANVNPSSGG
ncbi:MAG: hypothetical protein JST12_17335 [Armatimonadetes bacterium]|nr:hypothetical protein [Armatimonadota bacterium]